MEQIVWSNIARLSLKDIWDFYAEKSTPAADKIIEEIISAAESLSYKDQYQVEELLGEEFRRAVVRHFKVIYRVHEDHLRIIDVFDARQNPNTLKNKSL